MPEWVIVNGHVLGQCAYLNSDDLDEPCDCQDLQDNMRDDVDEEYDDYSGDLAYEGSW
jgi:hypothetical protein